MRRFIFPVCALALAFAGPVVAQSEPNPPAPGDFALRIALGVSGENGVVQFPLPVEVYRQSRNPALADLRVFRADGTPEAFHLLQQQPASQIRQSQRPTVLFPLWTKSADQLHSQLSLSIDTGSDGSVQWTSKAPSAPAAQTRLTAIIVDLGAQSADEWLAALSFSAPAAGVGYQATLAVSRSTDLKLWDNVAQSPLSWLSSAGGDQQLRNDRIALTQGRGRYLKLQWVSGDPSLFSAVQAHWRSRSESEPAMHEWVIDGLPGHYETDWVYSATPAVAASVIGLQLPESNTVLPVSFGQYYRSQRKPQTWQYRAQIDATFYRLLRDGVDRQSSDLTIRPLALEQWVLRASSPIAAPPQLILRWQPQTLVFVAQGQRHILAVGAEPATVRKWGTGVSALQRVAPGYSRDDLEQLEHAVVATNQTVLEAPVSTQPGPSPVDPQSQRYWLLWATLGLGLLFLGFMTWRLYLQINSEADKPD